ncbi:hypothetical protein HanIR_Chr15g0759651 [Helianthus annuus]|nr:hypothetical protein HanIR_Chr15g0759651 [Helianthus annuus]
MESSANALPSTPADIQDCGYLNASNANVSNFISVKLSSKHNYLLWKAQILCMLGSNDMRGIVDAAFVTPRDYGISVRRKLFGKN